MRTHHPGKAPGTDQSHRTADPTATPDARLHAAIYRSAVDDVPSSPGTPLAGPHTAETGTRPGADFSHVPVHTASAARASAAEAGARACPERPHVVAGYGGAGKLTLALQRSVGNAAVSRMPEQARHQHGGGPGHQQTAPAPVQRSAVRDVLSSPGQPLASPLKEEMEARLRGDFSRVRVHTDDAARASAAAVGARAYTSRNHVVIGAGAADRHILAHELTHVLQHRQGPVTGTDDGSGLSLSDPSDRFERVAEAVAERAVHGTLQRPGNAGEAPSAPPAAGGRLIVSRLMDAGKFQAKTKPLIPLIGRRPESIGSIDQALAAYHAIPIDEYQRRVDGLAGLVQTCDAYLAGRGLTALPAETSVAPASAAGLPARPTAQPVAALAEGLLSLLQRHTRSVTLLREQAQREQQAFASLAQAQAADSLPARFKAYAQAHEVLLEARRRVGPDDFEDVYNWVIPLLENTVDEMRTREPGALTDLVREDVEMLRKVAAAGGLPDITRLLAEVPANVPSSGAALARFEVGTPGSKLSRAGAEKYTVTHALVQRGGVAERLGSLTHELTHVSAGETFDNTPLFLLFDPNATGDQIKKLAKDRVARLNGLEGLLDSPPTRAVSPFKPD